MIKSKNKKAVRWIHNGIDYVIKKSDKPNHKLMALYTEGNKTKKIYFGGVREDSSFYQHFYDKTGLLPKELNHNDKERRRLYRARHEPRTNFREPSPGLLSWFLLW